MYAIFFSNSCSHAGPKHEILHRDQVQHINVIQKGCHYINGIIKTLQQLILFYLEDIFGLHIDFTENFRKHKNNSMYCLCTCIFLSTKEVPCIHTSGALD